MKNVVSKILKFFTLNKMVKNKDVKTLLINIVIYIGIAFALNLYKNFVGRIPLLGNLSYNVAGLYRIYAWVGAILAAIQCFGNDDYSDVEYVTLEDIKNLWSIQNGKIALIVVAAVLCLVPNINRILSVGSNDKKEDKVASSEVKEMEEAKQEEYFNDIVEENDISNDEEYVEEIQEESVEVIPSGINIKSQIVKDYLGGDYREETEVINGVKYYVYPNGVVANIVEENYYFFDNCEYNGKDIILAICGENQFCTNSAVIGINPDITLTLTESKNMTEIPENIKYVESLDNNISGDLVIPDSVELFAPYGGIPANVESLTLSDNVTYLIGADFDYNVDTASSFYPQIVFYKSFQMDSKLKEATIPDGVGVLYHTFSGCENLEKVTLPNTITEIGMGAFTGCVNLTEITIPENTEIIGRGAFADCAGLTEIKIPDGVTTIEDVAFAGCTGLTEMVLPDSVVYIGVDAFSRCENLARLEVPANMDEDSFNKLSSYCHRFVPNIEIIKR